MGPLGTRVTLGKVDGDHASWRAGGGAQAARSLLLAGYFWAQLACGDPSDHVGPCGLLIAPACQRLQVPETEGSGDLEPLTWTPWEVVEVKVGKSCPRPWPSRSSGRVLAEQKKCTCSLLVLSCPCASLTLWGTAALLPSSFLIFLTLSVSREVQPHLLWILASVTWK